MSNAPNQNDADRQNSPAHSPLGKPADTKPNPVVEGKKRSRVEPSHTEEPQPSEPLRDSKKRTG